MGFVITRDVVWATAFAIEFRKAESQWGQSVWWTFDQRHNRVPTNDEMAKLNLETRRLAAGDAKRVADQVAEGFDMAVYPSV